MAERGDASSAFGSSKSDWSPLNGSLPLENCCFLPIIPCKRTESANVLLCVLLPPVSFWTSLTPVPSPLWKVSCLAGVAVSRSIRKPTLLLRAEIICAGSSATFRDVCVLPEPPGKFRSYMVFKYGPFFGISSSVSANFRRNSGEPSTFLLACARVSSSFAPIAL